MSTNLQVRIIGVQGVTITKADHWKINNLLKAYNVHWFTRNFSADDLRLELWRTKWRNVGDVNWRSHSRAIYTASWTLKTLTIKWNASRTKDVAVAWNFSSFSGDSIIKVSIRQSERQYIHKVKHDTMKSQRNLIFPFALLTDAPIN